MEIKIGMYVRTKNGITKIYEIDEHKTKWKYLYKLKKQDGDDCIDLGVLSEEDILKASYNIAEIIEENDYINDDIVTEKFYDYANKEWCFNSIGNCLLCREKDIKSIVTREYFEQGKYIVGE